VKEWILNHCVLEDLKKQILTDINIVGRENGLCGYEIPRAVFLEPKPFSVESGVITPTFKLRRKAAAEKYASALKEMYQSVIE